MPRDTPHMWTQLEKSRFQFVTWGCGPDVNSFEFLKMDLFLFIFVFTIFFYNFYNKYVWKSVYPVYCAGIRIQQPSGYRCPLMTTRTWLALKEFWIGR